MPIALMAWNVQILTNAQMEAMIATLMLHVQTRLEAMNAIVTQERDGNNFGRKIQNFD